MTEANTVSLLCFIFLHVSLGYSSVLDVSLIQGAGTLVFALPAASRIETDLWSASRDYCLNE